MIHRFTCGPALIGLKITLNEVSNSKIKIFCIIFSVINPKFRDNVSSANRISFAVPYNEDVRFNIILNDTSKEESLGNKSNANIDTKLCIWIHYTAEIKNEKIEITYDNRTKAFNGKLINFDVSGNGRLSEKPNINADNYNYMLPSNSTIIKNYGTNYKLCDRAGFLGQFCNISCALILGEAHAYCENHKICSDNQCTCAWGYDGDACDQRTGISEQSVYCRNESTLWIRWKALKTFLNYTIQYHHEANEWNSSNYTYPCENMENFTCTVLENLKNDSTYNISIRYLNAAPVYTVGKTEARKLKMTLQSKPLKIIASYNDCGPLFHLDVDVISDQIHFTESNKDVHHLTFTSNYDGNFELLSVNGEKDWMLNLCKTNGTYNNDHILKKYNESEFANFALNIQNSTLLIRNQTRLLYLIHISEQKLIVCSISNNFQSRDPNNIVYIQKWLKLLTSEQKYIIYSCISMALIVVILLPAVLLYRSIKRRRSKFEISTFENDLRKAIISNKLFDQFDSVPAKKRKQTLVALQSDNIEKNIVQDYVPYDFNRVVLKEMKDVESGDYINASFINGYSKPKAYIICQGPQYNTLQDFWRMIWQERIETIVMCTNFTENGEKVCEKYWPQNVESSLKFGTISIKLVNEFFFENYTRRQFVVSYFRYVRQVEHFHLKWNLQEVMFPNDIVPFVLNLRKISGSSEKTIVIHSGFGIDRSATLILCDMALQMVAVLKKINFLQLAKILRKQRSHMLNNKQHYIFAHLIVLECLMEKENPFNIAETNIAEEISDKVIDEQFMFLARLSWHDTTMQHCLPHIKTDSKISVNGYAHNRKYIVSKQPSEDHFLTFWTMILNENIACIVFLNQLIEIEKRRLFRDTQPHADSNNLIRVVEVERKSTASYTTTHFKVLIFNTSTEMFVRETKFEFIELNGWEPNRFGITCLENIVKAVRYFSTNVPKQSSVIVACRDGISETGVFLSVLYVLEKYEQELKLDVCNSIRILRRNCSLFINSPEQLSFIYKLIQEYLHSR